MALTVGMAVGVLVVVQFGTVVLLCGLCHLLSEGLLCLEVCFFMFLYV